MAHHEKLNKQPIQVNNSKKEYHRVIYSLKMALRMINGTFYDVQLD